MRTVAIIAAGGSGTRLGTDMPKQFVCVNDKPIMAYTLLTFNNSQDIHEIIVTSPAGYETMTEDIVSSYSIDKASKIITGGNNRQDTVYYALKAAQRDSIILIHDAVRPFVTQEEITGAIKGALAYGACSIGVPVKDTIKICDKNGLVINTPARETLWQIQTPQAFLYSIIKKAHEQARAIGYTATDDMGLVERMGCPTRIIMGSYSNIKITTKEDLCFFSRCAWGPE